jgi:hypothetical protein
VVKAGRARRGSRATSTLPSVESDVVMITTGRKKGGAVTESLPHLEAQYARTKHQETVEIGNFQVNVDKAGSEIDTVG